MWHATTAAAVDTFTEQATSKGITMLEKFLHF
jgi:hypothetical protein